MRLKITLESTSPVSWGGHDGSTDPLLVRVPPIRGSIRKWYRWYLASLSCTEPDIRAIWEREYEIFGGVHGAPKKSKVRLWFNSIEELKSFKMNFRDPFLWPLRKSDRTFYMIKFSLFLESEDYVPLNETAKALALNLTLGGLGYRSNRGYGSFRILEVERCESNSCEEAEKILRKAMDVTFSSNSSEWVKKVKNLLQYLRIQVCDEKLKLLNVQNLSNSYLVTLNAGLDWRATLEIAEEKLKNVERSLRARNYKNRDYRVLLGSPVHGRRPFVWKVRRTSPLILGVGGRTNNFIRGIFFISSDYSSDRNKYKDVIGHFQGIGGLAEAFDRVIQKLKAEGFQLVRMRW